MESPSSVATLKSRLELGHMVRRPSAPPVGLQTEDSENQPRKKPPPPPPPSTPPRKPSAFSPPIEPQSPGDAASKLEERNYGRMDDQEQHHHHSVPPSSPPPYAPPLPTRQNSNNFTARQTTAPPPPPQLPPRLPPRPPPRPKPESFAHSLLKKKPTPKPAGQGRSLPPPVIPPPVLKGTWGTPKEEPRRPSIGLSRPIQPPARPGTTETPSPPSLLPPPPPPPTSRPSLPPRKSLPSLRPLPTATLPIPPLPKRVLSQPQIEPVHVHQTEEPVAAPLPHRRNILSMGFGGKHGKLPSPPRTPQPETRPPPVPIGSRPAASAPTVNTGTKPGPPPLPAARPGTSAPSNHRNINTTCLKCRDFSHVDAHAAKFPRHAYDDVQRLALDLTRNFGSDTDKARVLFTWLHHNVVYDVDAFFNNAVQPSTPASTLRTGLAVCEGFAGLFAAMAMYSGLEAIVIGGHGKGYGWDGPDAKTIPSSPGGHAWNAVRIDNGVWQTIDPCWGAGYLCGAEYKQVFSPHHFTNTNEEFRKSHFPENPDQQVCAKPITFREYWLIEEGPKLYATFSEPDFDYGRDSVEPGVKTLQPHVRYRFRIAGPCEHKPATNNWILLINNGRKEEEQVMMPDGRGGFVADLTTGGSGSAVNLSVLTVFNDQSAKGRLTIDQWKNKRGANSWATSWLCKWDIA